MVLGSKIRWRCLVYGCRVSVFGWWVLPSGETRPEAGGDETKRWGVLSSGLLRLNLARACCLGAWVAVSESEALFMLPGCLALQFSGGGRGLRFGVLRV